MEVKTIKKLEVPQEFRKEGYNHKLVKFQSGVRDVAIYEVIKENWQFGSGHRGWEVLVIKYATKDTEYFGSVRPAGTAILPTSEQFGHYGWHYNKWDSVLKKFNELLTEPLGKGGKKSSIIFI